MTLRGKSVEMTKIFSDWNLKSCWAIRPSQRQTGDSSCYLLEHEVTVSGEQLGVELVAKFVHAFREARTNNQLIRGGLVSLTLRKRRDIVKRVGAKTVSRYTFYLKKSFLSPQTHATSNNSSPVVAPLALSIPNSNIVPLVPASDAVKEDIGTAPALPSPAAILPEQPCVKTETSQFVSELPPDANAAQTSAWLRARRFSAFESTFASFSASDIFRLSRDDLIQICGLADGIRLFNALHSKALTPKLTLYFSLEGSTLPWRLVYLDSLNSNALTSKLITALNLPQDRLHSILFLGPQGIHVLVTDELVANMNDESMYLVETIKDSASERYKLLLKPSSR